MALQYTEGIKYRKLDSDGDMLFGRSQKDFYSGLEAMRQVLSTRLKTIAGEWWEGDYASLPYFTEILGKKNPDKAQLDLLVIERLMDTIGVSSVGSITSTIVKRHYTFTAQVQTIYGLTTVSGEL